LPHADYPRLAPRPPLAPGPAGPGALPARLADPSTVPRGGNCGRRHARARAGGDPAAGQDPAAGARIGAARIPAGLVPSASSVSLERERIPQPGARLTHTFFPTPYYLRLPDGL